MDNLFWHLNGFFGVTLSPTFFRYCGTNWLWFFFKQLSIKDLDLIFDCVYTSWRKKNKDKVRYYSAQISFHSFFFLLFFYNFLILYRRFFSFSISFRFLLINLNLDRVYYGGLIGVNMGWQLTVFNNLCCDRGYPMLLESNLYYTKHLSFSKWGLTLVNLTFWEWFATTTAVQSWSYAVNLGSYDLDSGSFSFTIFWDAHGRNDLDGILLISIFITYQNYFFFFFLFAM
jgi:hypothetical protein